MISIEYRGVRAGVRRAISSICITLLRYSTIVEYPILFWLAWRSGVELRPDSNVEQYNKANTVTG
jgi:hypothetical protein